MSLYSCCMPRSEANSMGHSRCGYPHWLLSFTSFENSSEDAKNSAGDWYLAEQPLLLCGLVLRPVLQQQLEHCLCQVLVCCLCETVQCWGYLQHSSQDAYSAYSPEALPATTVRKRKSPAALLPAAWTACSASKSSKRIQGRLQALVSNIR